MVLTCDKCGKSEEFNGDYKYCTSEAKSQGWILFKRSDTWIHYCSKKCRDGTKERIDPSRVTGIKTIAVDVQKDSLIVSKFNNQEFLVKNESSGVFSDSFYASDLGIPWEDTKINLEEKFQEDFNKRISGKILVEDMSKLPLSMLGNAVDRLSIKAWVEHWISTHGDLAEDFKRNANELLKTNSKGNHNGTFHL